MHPSVNGVPTNRPTNQATTRPSQQPTKQPTSQATKPHNSVFSPSAVGTRNPVRGRLGLHCRGGAAPSPFTQHPSIHASINGVPTNRPTNQATTRPSQQTHQATNKPSNQTFSPNAVDTCFALVAHQATNKPSNQNDTTLCDPKRCRYLVRIAPSPAPPPAFIYTPSIYASIPATNPQTIHPSTHQTSKQPTNQATQTTQPCFPQMLSILGLHCEKALRPPPHTVPPLSTQHPSIHPSIHPSNHPPTKHTNRKIAYPSSTVSRKQSQQANQATNTPKRLYICPCP